MPTTGESSVPLNKFEDEIYRFLLFAESAHCRERRYRHDYFWFVIVILVIAFRRPKGECQPCSLAGKAFSTACWAGRVYLDRQRGASRENLEKEREFAVETGRCIFAERSGRICP